MPCIRHHYRLVSNSYQNGQPSPDSYEGATWVVEKRCSVCDCEAPELEVIIK